MFCTNCGNKIDNTTRFCIHCGAPTQQTPASPAMDMGIPEVALTVEETSVSPEVSVVSGSPHISNDSVPYSAENTPIIPQSSGQSYTYGTEMYNKNPNQNIAEGYSQDNNYNYNEVVPEKKKKSKKWILITGIVVIVLLIGGGAGFFLYQNHLMKQADQVVAYLEDGEYDKAFKLYGKYGGKKEAFDEQVLEELEERVKLIKTDYLSEKIEYTEAKNQLKSIEDYEFKELKKITKELSGWMEEIRSSRQNYVEGKSFFEQGNYADAIDKYIRVIREDKKYYTLAQEGLEEANRLESIRLEEEEKKNNKNRAFESAEGYANVEDYQAAYDAIQNVLLLYPYEEDLMEALAQYQMLHEMTLRVPSITSTSYSDTYENLGKEVMTVYMEFPVLEGDNPYYKAMNQIFQGIMKEYKDSCNAIAEDAMNYVEDEYFNPSFFDASYSVQYNDNGILSILIDGYAYTGGAHGYPIRDVVTFDLKTGERIGLEQLIATDEYSFGRYVIEEFEQMYYEYPYDYYDDAISLVQSDASSFATMDYVLMQDAISVFYYPYEVASYVRGFVDVIIPFEGNEWMFTFLSW